MGQSVLNALEVKKDGRQSLEGRTGESPSPTHVDGTDRQAPQRESLATGVKCGDRYLLPAFDELLKVASSN